MNINIQLMEEAAYDELIKTGDFHLRLTENGTRSGSADYILFDIYHTKGFYNDFGAGVFNYGEEIENPVSADETCPPVGSGFNRCSYETTRLLSTNNVLHERVRSIPMSKTLTTVRSVRVVAYIGDRMNERGD